MQRRQKELYDIASRDIKIPDGKIVYIRKNSASRITGTASRFIRNFEGRSIVTGHPYNRKNLLNLRNLQTGENYPRPFNNEKIVVLPDADSHDARRKKQFRRWSQSPSLHVHHKTLILPILRINLVFIYRHNRLSPLFHPKLVSMFTRKYFKHENFFLVIVNQKV